MAECSAKQLGLSKADLPNSIIEVIATLSKSGFDAYIVGGGVRDTLLGLSPKDFDAVTDAKPHEIKDLFGKRCRIIGRRFQLAHVYSGRDMIEVATFRAPPKGEEHTTSDGMIVRDNVWGDIKQDFSRRDFSINAMYYEPIKGIVHDFCNALDDIENKIIRLLGHAPLRIEEDPVRLLRALRFKAKLGFEFDDALESQFHDDNWGLLEQVSPHRLYDESQKMFTGGYLVPLLPLLFKYGAIKHLIVYPPKAASKLVTQVAINTDKRIALGKSINPAFFYAALLWENYLHQLAKFKKKNMPFHDAQMQASIKVIERQRIKTAIPRFAEQFIRDIWLLQPKLANPKIKQIPQLAEHARFRAAFDFLLLREQCDDAANPLSESTNGMGEWWQTFQTLSDKEKQLAINDFSNDNRRAPSKSSRNRRARNRQNENDPINQANVELDSGSELLKDELPNRQAADSKMTQSTKQSETKTATSSRSTKKTAVSRPRSAGQKRHDAQERAQLKKLSLNQLLGESQLTTDKPKPLFTINDEKLAEQVPKQLEIDEKIESTVKIESNAKPPVKPTNIQEAEASQKSNDKASRKSDAVLLPKADTVPAKRRRRQPTQLLTQKEMKEANQQRQDKTKHSEEIPVTKAVTLNETSGVNDESTASVASKPQSSKPKSSKPKSVEPKSSERVVKNTEKPKTETAKTSLVDGANSHPDHRLDGDSNVKKDTLLHSQTESQKNTRVPATRRRRVPSSNLSVREREINT